MCQLSARRKSLSNWDLQGKDEIRDAHYIEVVLEQNAFNAFRKSIFAWFLGIVLKTFQKR